ncbi:BRO family protein [Pseudomonas protegens]|uniref:BRO-N domain-containing protein n=1 Tax=Pseudomonas protegens TaxID=380021 RepID=UPI002758C1E2|nr:BRO family protein [Pseudomonas protegens]MDP9511092.1 BRO family protein [Pseudomonas protegens]
MNQVQNFTFGLMNIRVIEHEGQPWFVAADVCKGLAIGNTSAATEKLPATDKSQLNLGLPGKPPLVVSEAGLYKLVMRSDKPEAKAFQDWVTRVVLPAIRKDGAYVMGEEKVATGELSEDELVMRAMTIMTRKVDRLTQERDQLARDKQALAITNEALLPAATVGQALAKRKALGVVDFCRKLPGVAVNAVQTRLYDMQYLHKKPGHWSVYAKFKGVLFDETYDHLGYSKVVVLEAGQNKLVELYHKGLLPMLKGRKPEKALELGA